MSKALGYKGFEYYNSKLKDKLKEFCDSTDDVNVVYEKMCNLLDKVNKNFRKLNGIEDKDEKDNN